MNAIISHKTTAEATASNPSQWKESIAIHKKEISFLIKELGKLKLNVLDFNTKLQLFRFGDLLQTYDEQLQHLMIDLFLTEQDVQRLQSNKHADKYNILQNALQVLLQRLKAFEGSFSELRKDFMTFWENIAKPTYA